jgi:hypothetical protein
VTIGQEAAEAVAASAVAAMRAYLNIFCGFVVT